MISSTIKFSDDDNGGNIQPRLQYLNPTPLQQHKSNSSDLFLPNPLPPIFFALPYWNLNFLDEQELSLRQEPQTSIFAPYVNFKIHRSHMFVIPNYVVQF